jgi:hypothetical protein
MEATETALNGKANRVNGVKVTNEASTSEVAPRRKRHIPEVGQAISGDAIGNDTVGRRWSKKPTTWKALLKSGTGNLFSRTSDGKFVYQQQSKSLAKSLDGLEDLRVPADQQGMEVYQVWLTTF